MFSFIAAASRRIGRARQNHIVASPPRAVVDRLEPRLLLHAGDVDVLASSTAVTAEPRQETGPMTIVLSDLVLPTTPRSGPATFTMTYADPDGVDTRDVLIRGAYVTRVPNTVKVPEVAGDLLDMDDVLGDGTQIVARWSVRLLPSDTTIWDGVETFAIQPLSIGDLHGNFYSTIDNRWSSTFSINNVRPAGLELLIEGDRRRLVDAGTPGSFHIGTAADLDAPLELSMVVRNYTGSNVTINGISLPAGFELVDELREGYDLVREFPTVVERHDTPFTSPFLMIQLTAQQAGDYGGTVTLTTGAGPITFEVHGTVGTSSFGAPVTYPLPSSGFNTAGHVLVDLDKDGSLDMASTVSQAETGAVVLAIRYGVGDDTFGELVLTPMDDEAASLAAGDVNGDGVIDLVMARTHSISLYTLDPATGRYSLVDEVIDGRFGEGFGLIVERVDDDEFADVIFLGDGNLCVMRGAASGLGTIEEPHRDPLLEKRAEMLHLDLTGDGIKDVVAIRALGTFNKNERPLLVFPGDGSGSFGDAISMLDPRKWPLRIAAGDMNGDGLVDLAFTHEAGVSVAINGPNGLVTRSTWNLLRGVDAVALGDIDGDGDLDVVASGGRSSIHHLWTLRNDGTGTLTDAVAEAVPKRAGELSLADVNEDGRLDVISQDAYAGTFHVLPNEATVTEPAGPQVSVSRDGNGVSGPIDLGTSQLGAAGEPVTLTLQNDGTAPLTIGTPIVPPGFEMVQPPAATVPAGASTTVVIRIAMSQNAGPLNGTLTMTTNAPASPQFIVNLTGQVAPELDIEFSGRVRGVFTESDGTVVTVALSGPGSGKIRMGLLEDGGTGPVEVTVAGTTSRSAISITARGGDRRARVPAITVDGPLRALSAPSGDVVGDVSVAGTLGSLVVNSFAAGADFAAVSLAKGKVAGDVRGGMRIDGALGTMSIGGSVAGDVSISAGSLGAWTTKGDLAASSLRVAGGVGKVTVGGTIGAGVWVVGGAMTSLAAGSVADAVAIGIGGPFGTLTTKSNFAGALAASQIKSITIGGDIVGGQVLAGAWLGEDAEPGDPEDTYAGGTIGKVTVRGALSGGSVIAAGLQAGAGNVLSGDETLLPDPTSSIRSVVIRGGIADDCRIVAPTLPAKAILGRVRVTTAESPHFML
ncbi:MAG TPA: FG-GAP-like repeat-containing protein [Tepidisphaeraceae bacterium]|nr:FG-GAP-like repeat-containing protein [Tepidisphaeraceae bacterium]